MTRTNPTATSPLEKTKAWLQRQQSNEQKLKAARQVAAVRRARKYRAMNPASKEESARRVRHFRQNNLEAVREQERLRYHKKKQKDQNTMKNKSFVITLVAALSLQLSAISHAASPYKQGEVTADVFGTYSQSKAKLNDAFDREFKNGTYGAGLGFNYFFHRNFALGVDAVVPSAAHATHSFFDQVNLDLTARLPLGDSAFAPYATGGMGRNMETGEYTSHTALGLEYRIAKAVGVFVEGRYTWGNRDNSDFAQARAGLRFNF